MWARAGQDRVNALVYDLAAPAREPTVVEGAWAPGTILFSPNGRFLGINTEGSRVIDLESGQVLWSNDGFKVNVYAFSPDGRRILATTPGGYGWQQIDLMSRQVVDTGRGHNGDLCCAGSHHGIEHAIAFFIQFARSRWQC